MNSSWAEFLSTAAVFAVVAALVGVVLGLLERTDRRTGGFSRAPFGADLVGDRDIIRTLDELRARPCSDDISSEPRVPRPASPAPQRPIQHAGRTGRRAAA